MQKSILITGCSSGIGYNASHSLAKRGWRVFATCRQETDCARLEAEGLESFPLDYSSPKSVADAVSETLARTEGRIDAVFNNGAYAIPGALEDIPREALSAIFETNLIGYHDLTRRLIPAMRRQGHGRIVNNSSILGFIGLKWRGAYVATKFAMEGLTDVLRLEMQGTGIHPILIEPGPITSRIRQNAAIQFEKWIDVNNSVRRPDYEALQYRLYDETGSDKFELPASAVTAKLIHALESPKPRPRYYVTTPTHFMGATKRVASTRVLDWLLAKG